MPGFSEPTKLTIGSALSSAGTIAISQHQIVEIEFAEYLENKSLSIEPRLIGTLDIGEKG